jgi:hypothetical protein
MKFEESIRTKTTERNSQVVSRDILHRGWVFADPYLPPHKDVEAFQRDLLKERNRNLAHLDFCAGKGKRPPDDYRPSGCTPEMLKEYRDNIQSTDMELRFVRSLQVSEGQKNRYQRAILSNIRPR